MGRRPTSTVAMALCVHGAIIMIMAGCAHVPPPARPSSIELWRIVKDAQSRTPGPYLAEGEIGLEAGTLIQSFNFTFRWADSRHVRLDLTGPLGIGLASAAVVDSTAWMSVPLQGLHLNGSLGLLDSNSNRAMGLPWERLLGLLQGRPPLPEGDYQGVQTDGSLTSFSISSGDTMKVYAIERSTGDVRGYRLLVRGKFRAGIAYDDFRIVGQCRLPHSISLTSPPDELKVDIVYARLKGVAQFPDAIWHQRQIP